MRYDELTFINNVITSDNANRVNNRPGMTNNWPPPGREEDVEREEEEESLEDAMR